MVSKKEFHTSKQGIALSLVDTDKMVASEKFKYSYNGSKYFIGYLDDDDNIIRPLCIMLPQMSGYIKHFYDSGKNICFKFEDDCVYPNCNEIWKKIKKTLRITFHS